jgi:hypothetical protein
MTGTRCDANMGCGPHDPIIIVSPPDAIET